MTDRVFNHRDGFIAWAKEQDFTVTEFERMTRVFALAGVTETESAEEAVLSTVADEESNDTAMVRSGASKLLELVTSGGGNE